VVMLGLQNEREWQSFCAVVLERPELATDARFASNVLRNENREALRPIVLECFSRLTAAQLRERLDRAQIANADLNDMHDVWSHPQLAARGRWARVGSEAGELPVLKPPGISDRFEPRLDAVPRLGEHNAKILRELGLGDNG